MLGLLESEISETIFSNSSSAASFFLKLPILLIARFCFSLEGDFGSLGSAVSFLFLGVRLATEYSSLVLLGIMATLAMLQLLKLLLLISTITFLKTLPIRQNEGKV